LDDNYGSHLDAAGLSYQRRGVWLQVGESQRVQGWKLHLSTTSAQAKPLLTVVLPLLAQAQTIFKCAASRSVIDQLNGGELGETQVGKAITIYPRNDDEAIQLARDLRTATVGFEGPEIATDLKLGDIVYTRYGGFNPRVLYDRLGQSILAIKGQDGQWHRDDYKIPFSCPEGVLNPFYEGVPPAATCDLPAARLLNGRYLLVEAVKPSLLGSVFRALDIQDSTKIEVRIVKQGRPHCHSDELGRDARTRLQHQEHVQRALAGLSGIPRADRYFAVNNIGYLPMEYVEGRTIEVEAVTSLQSRPWVRLGKHTKMRLLDYARQLNIAVSGIHRGGFVHRDIAASNVWIGRDNRVYLIDFELAYELGSREDPFWLGTVGFISPNQFAHGPPRTADDVYAIVCVLVLLLTGLDPRRIVHGSRDALRARLTHLTGLSSSEVLDCVCATLSAPFETEPTIADLTVAIEKEARDTEKGVQLHRTHTTDASIVELHTLTQAGLQTLAANLAAQLAASMSIISDIAPLDLDAHRGVAGMVYVLARAAKARIGGDELHSVTRRAVELLIRPRDEDPILPGLYFGRAGRAVAVAEAIAAGLVDSNPSMLNSIQAMLEGELDWPDITHGAAGQGLAALYCGEQLNNSALASLSHRCAAYLLNSQQPDGSWIIPAGVEGMSGDTLTGFAHGIAGIVYFLCDYDRKFSHASARRSWQRGYTWLVAKAQYLARTNSINWHYSDKIHDMWQWWCHGAPGIALTLLRLIEAGHEEFVDSDLVTRALRLNPKDIRYPHLSQCHGLAGLAEIYLEAYRTLHEREWYERAMHLVETILVLSKQSEGRLMWMVEQVDPTSELMIGSAGIIHLLLRVLKGSAVGGFPLLSGPYL
jgi:serine/threonine protein kinase